MLPNTLCHIPRISLKKERTLWEQGVQTWESYRAIARDPAFLDDCEQRLRQGDPAFFARLLPSDQHWRLFADFRNAVAYVDIETTGLNKAHDQITTIALYNGDAVKTYVNGRNLDDFTAEIMNYKLLVTFNGKTFDVPFIEHYFKLKLPHAHIDLRYVLRRLGFSGGLKEIERRVGIDRGGLRSVDGFFAVTLWYEYIRKNNQAALETLLAYNCADVVNLEQLMVLAYNRNVMATPFGGGLQLNTPEPAKIPFEADPVLVERWVW